MTSIGIDTNSLPFNLPVRGFNIKIAIHAFIITGLKKFGKF